MKIVRYIGASGPQFGIVENGVVSDLEGSPLSNPSKGREVGSLDSLKLAAPCTPGKIIAMGINFPGATGLTKTMKEPLVFLKAGTSVCGPQDDIISPFGNLNIWGECELAVVVGKRLRNVNEAEARNGILGFTAANDVSADNIEDWDHHLARSKSADTFCPLGPWIDTEYSPLNRVIEGFQNGELIRRGNSDERIWRDTHAIAWLSTWMTLEPWDVLLTGAPTRVVPRRYLKEGDEFVVRVDGLGELRNRFREKRS